MARRCLLFHRTYHKINTAEHLKNVNDGFAVLDWHICDVAQSVGLQNSVSTHEAKRPHLSEAYI